MVNNSELHAPANPKAAINETLQVLAELSQKNKKDDSITHQTAAIRCSVVTPFGPTVRKSLSLESKINGG